MGKVLGLDYGTKRIGVAISDETRTLAREIGIWPAGNFFVQLRDFLKDNDEVDQLVVGLPLNMSGADTAKTEEARQFALRAGQESGLAVDLTDERLSSSMARGIPGSGSQVDGVAAELILQNYLDRIKNSTNE